MTELTIQQKFEEKIKDKLRETIGDMIPDDLMNEMTQKAFKSVFFEKRESNDRYSNTKRPSWFEEEVEKLMIEQVKEKANKIITDNSKELEKLIKSKLVEDSSKFAASVLLKIFSSNSSNLAYQIQEVLRNLPR